MTVWISQGTGSCAERVEVNLVEDCTYLTVVKEANPLFVENEGDIITYTITVTNNNIISVGSINIVDPLIPLTFIGGDDNNNNLIDFGEIWIYQGTYTVTLSDFNDNGIDFNGNADNDGDIDNMVVVSGTTSNNNPVAEIIDTAEVELIQDPSISMTKSGPEEYCNTDQEITYNIIVTNTGNITLTGVTITDNNADSIVPSVISSIEPGQSVNVTATHILTEADFINSQVENSATVEAISINGDIVTDISDDPNNLDNIDLDGNEDPDDITIVLHNTDCDSLPNIIDVDDDNDGIIDIVENNGFDPDFDQDGDNVPQYLDDDDNDVNIGNDDGLPQNDSDGDNFPDHLDIDSDNDGIPDNVEGQITDGYIPPTEQDTDNDGLDDAYDNIDDIGIVPQDTDEDTIPDYLDIDSDNDNVPDNIEGNDENHNGIADYTMIGTDEDNDGLDNGFEGGDINDQDVNDEIDLPLVDLPDNDTDATEDGDVDYRDTDDDNDGIPTEEEDNDGDGDYANDDCDDDGYPDYLDADTCFIEMPEGFSPNNDGVNDNYFVEGLANLYPDFTIEIYDRYGNMIYNYTHDGTQNEPEWWNGVSNGRLTFAKNKGVPAGTYFYILYPNKDGVKPKQGWLYVNK